MTSTVAGAKTRARAGVASGAVLAVVTAVCLFASPFARKRAEPGAGASDCSPGSRTLFSKPRLDVRMVFGYKDARPARFVGDRYESLVFTQALLARCEGKSAACGFTRVGEHLERELTRSDGRSLTVAVTVTRSSVGPDDDENRRNPFQAWQSREARNAFLGALAHADVVLYNGHSRAGGGPDFEPPVLETNHHVRYAWYKARKPGLAALESGLRSAKASPLCVLGLFSCVSGPLFKARLEQVRRGLDVVASDRLLYFSDSIAQSLGELSSLLTMRCEATKRLANIARR